MENGNLEVGVHVGEQGKGNVRVGVSEMGKGNISVGVGVGVSVWGRWRMGTWRWVCMWGR
jgi:hypothetical protein